jgi:hypothetical protein
MSGKMTLTETVLATAKAAHRPCAEPCFEEAKPLPPPPPEKVTEEEHKRHVEKQMTENALRRS